MLKTLVRAAKGAASLDEMLELMSSLGVEAEVQPINNRAELEGAAAAAAAPGARLFQMRATLKGGSPLLALLILPPG